MGRFLTLGGSRSLQGALSRVHTFKRVGEPLAIVNDLGVARVTLGGNTDLLNGVITGSADSFFVNASQIRGAFQFSLSQAANVSEITNLFDNYRIVKVKLLFNFTANSVDMQAGVGATQSQLPIMHSCYDPDDNTMPASRTSVLENGYCQTRRLDKQFSVTVVPRAQQSVVGGGASGGGLLPTGTWLDSNSPAIKHYGLKFWIDQFPYTGFSSTAGITVTPTYYIEAKNVV